MTTPDPAVALPPYPHHQSLAYRVMQIMGDEQYGGAWEWTDERAEAIDSLRLALAQPAEAKGEREAFEAWIRREYGGCKGFAGVAWSDEGSPRFANDDNPDASLWEEWQGFQAGRASPSSPSPAAEAKPVAWAVVDKDGVVLPMCDGEESEIACFEYEPEARAEMDFAMSGECSPEWRSRMPFRVLALFPTPSTRGGEKALADDLDTIAKERAYRESIAMHDAPVNEQRSREREWTATQHLLDALLASRPAKGATETRVGEEGR